MATPDTNLPAVFRGGKDVDSNANTIAQITWQKFFDNPELNQLIEDALSHNYDLQLALKNIEAANLILKQTKLGNVPTIAVAITASESRPSDNSLNGLSLKQFLGSSHIEDYLIGASVSWEADIWGKIKSKKDAALADFLGTQEARKAVQTRIVNDIAKSYYNLLFLHEEMAIAKRNIILNDSTLKIIQLQFTYGHATALAVQQAMAQKLAAASLLPTFERQIAIQENAICILSGRQPNTTLITGILDSVSFTETLNAGVPSQIISHRPDVQQIELSLQAANANVGFAKASLYPSFVISAQAGLDAIKASNWFNIPASLFGAVAGSLVQPVFNQKRLTTQYNLAIIKRDQTVMVFRQSVLSALGEVSDALIKIDKLKQEQLLATQRTSTLQQAIRNAQSLYQNGLANYLEVIVAQSNALQSDLQLANIKKARLDAIVDLYKSVGGGWF